MHSKCKFLHIVNCSGKKYCSFVLIYAGLDNFLLLLHKSVIFQTNFQILSFGFFFTIIDCCHKWRLLFAYEVSSVYSVNAIDALT